MRCQLALIFLFSMCLHAQQPDPVLRHRSPESEQVMPAVSSGISLLPQDAAGEYRLNENDVIEITLDSGHLSGYIEQYANHRGDEGIPFTFLFASVTVAGQRFTFTTQKLHQQWYSFNGTIIRGEGKTWGDEGYYIMAGTLTEHDGPSSRPRHLSLKSMPVCVEQSCQ